MSYTAAVITVSDKGYRGEAGRHQRSKSVQAAGGAGLQCEP